MSTRTSSIHRTRRASCLAALFTALITVTSTPLQAGPVNINTADAPTLARELKGIGLVRAQAIVAHRAKNGPFRTADDLGLVKGIGPRVIDQNRADIRVGEGRAPVAARSPNATRPAAAAR